MAKSATTTGTNREIDIDGTPTTYTWFQNKEDITVRHARLNEFRCLSVERADAIVAHALRIKWRYPNV